MDSPLTSVARYRYTPEGCGLMDKLTAKGTWKLGGDEIRKCCTLPNEKCYLNFAKSKLSNRSVKPAENAITRQLDYSLSHGKYICTKKEVFRSP